MQRGRIDLLEGLRGYLALWVMIVHILEMSAIHPTGKALRHLFNIFLAQGMVPVGLFMALSGFVIFFLLEQKRETYTVFIARRFLRIYPAYIVVFLVSVLISASYTKALPLLPWADDPWIQGQVDYSTIHREHLWKNVLTHVTLLHGFVPKSLWPNATDAFLGVAWSISTEWQFYLLAPFCYAACKKPKGLVLLSLLVFGVFFVFSILGRGLMFVNVMPSLLSFHVQYFYLGAASCLAWIKLRSHVIDASPLSIMCVGVSLLCFLLIVEPIIGFWAFVMSALYVASVGDSSSPVVRAVEWVFCNPKILFLGRISYSLYLVHFLVGGECMLIISWLPEWPRLVQRAIFLIATSSMSIVVAALMYKYVELPFINLSKRIQGSA